MRREDMSQLGSIFVQLATTCNGRCAICPHEVMYGKGGVHPRARMGEDVWRALLNGIRQADYRQQVGLYLHHEPLTVPELFDRIAQLRADTKAFAAISTNCSLLNAENRKRLIAAGPRLVYLHVASGDKAQFGAITGLHFETVLSNAQAFVREAPPEMSVQVVNPSFVGQESLVHLFAPGKVVTDFWAVNRGGTVDRPDLLDARGKKTRFNDRVRGRCFQPDVNISILADGSSLICSNDWAQETRKDWPNVMDGGIRGIYFSKAAQRARDDFAAGRYDRYGCCSACWEENGFERSAT